MQLIRGFFFKSLRFFHAAFFFFLFFSPLSGLPGTTLRKQSSLGSLGADHRNHIQQGSRNSTIGGGASAPHGGRAPISHLTVWPARGPDLAFLGYPYSVSKLAGRRPEWASTGSALCPGRTGLESRAGASRSRLGLWVLPRGLNCPWGQPRPSPWACPKAKLFM